MKISDAAYNALELFFLSLLLAGCTLTGGTFPPTPATSPVISDALRHTNAQDAFGILSAELEQREAETFAGLWIQQEPTYRVVVAFTRNGPETIRPYLEHTSLAGLVEVRDASVSLAELEAIQQQVSQLVQELGFAFDTSINVVENKVEVYVTDRVLFESSLQKAHRRLPEHVDMVVTYEPLGSTVPFAVTPVSSVFFPQLRARSSTYMTALLQGKLVVKEGCLRVCGIEEEAGELIIWQADYFLNLNQGIIELLDRKGQVVARVGENVSLSGGEVPLAAEVEQQLREPLPKQCTGPYWLMGNVVPNERHADP